MFMRFRGGGVGHHTIRKSTNRFLHDRDPSDMPVSEANSSALREESNGLDDDEQMLDTTAEDPEEDGLGDDESEEDDGVSDEESESGDSGG